MDHDPCGEWSGSQPTPPSRSCRPGRWGPRGSWPSVTNPVTCVYDPRPGPCAAGRATGTQHTRHSTADEHTRIAVRSAEHARPRTRDTIRSTRPRTKLESTQSCRAPRQRERPPRGGRHGPRGPRYTERDSPGARPRFKAPLPSRAPRASRCTRCRRPLPDYSGRRREWPR